ncbi:MAG: ABC transporter permease [Thermobacillus sp. ZCTH02-B1]|uniref:carbohydrate ABC transporter permease n=1 Tax=Thermobacillus sp. ZCTH02-B1 TaxID=1858795 RepID=UPI000B555043|nr:sugar ABC transporter permease [Thermobacillus sp. ZCTH02-B1]OUM94209.1 MAG: ABC transporter permease [Thermobacillus sp. ZCTH02-B1]
MKPSKGIYLFVLPALILYGIFVLYPAFYGLYVSFTNWDGLSAGYEFVGFRNYRNLLMYDTIFAKSVVNNLKFMLFVVIGQTTLSLVFALFLVRNTKANIALRTLYFLPTILASVSVAFIWAAMYDSNFGMIKAILGLFGVQNGPGWLADPDIAIYSVAFAQVWAHTGQLMIIFIAGLQAIPADLFEVAAIEGASKFQTFRLVTWPLIAPAAAIVIAYTTLQSFKAFDLVFAMTRGGPNNATEIIATFIYRLAFQSYKFGYASAASMLFLVFVAAITIIQFKLLRTDRTG